MVVVRRWAFPALVLGLVLAPEVARGQAGLSDLVKEFVTDGNGKDIPLNPAPGEFRIPENTPEGVTTINVPKLDVDYAEGNTSLISDRLHIDAYTITVTNDDNPSGLVHRAGAIVIPASALEAFIPISIFGTSDGNPTSGTTASDHLSIVQGFYGANTGTTVLDTIIPEPANNAAEARLDFNIPAVKFDVVEPNAPTGTISDYVDLSTLTGFFLSSDNQTDYAGLPAANGKVIESVDTGASVHYAIGFASDPEPASIVSMGVGLATLGLFTLRRKTRARRAARGATA